MPENFNNQPTLQDDIASSAVNSTGAYGLQSNLENTLAEPARFENALETWNFDVDGDGQVTALSDGIMVARYLLGSVVVGDALTNGAIGANATRTTEQIRAHIKQGFDSGFLDINGDGISSTSSDGMLIVRHLFGAAFAGDALTDGISAPNATRTAKQIRSQFDTLTNLDISSRPYINVDSLAETLDLDQVQTIKWSDNINNNVAIELLDADDNSLVTTITQSTASDGSFEWDIPETLTLNSNYKIAIKNISDNALIAYSNSFVIMPQSLSQGTTRHEGSVSTLIGGTNGCVINDRNYIDTDQYTLDLDSQTEVSITLGNVSLQIDPNYGSAFGLPPNVSAETPLRYSILNSSGTEVWSAFLGSSDTIQTILGAGEYTFQIALFDEYETPPDSYAVCTQALTQRPYSATFDFDLTLTPFKTTDGDVNGDGTADIFGFREDDPWVSFSNGDGSFAAPREAFADDTLFPHGDFNKYHGWHSFNSQPRTLADVNGDGRADIVGFREDNVWVSLSNGDGSFTAPQEAFTGTQFPNGDFNKHHGWHSFNEQPRMLADVNGDGRADIVGFREDNVWVSLSNGDGTFVQAVEAFTGTQFPKGDFNEYHGWHSFNEQPRILADVNGDGRADIVGFREDNVWVSLSNGDGTFAQAAEAFTGTQFPKGDFNEYHGWHSFNEQPRTLADVNGDGRADIVGFREDNTWVSLSNGDGTFAQAVEAFTGTQFPKGDFNEYHGWNSFNNQPRTLGNVPGGGVAADLTIGAITTQESGLLGRTITTSAVVVNQGQIAASASNIHYWLGDSNNWHTANKIYLGEGYTNSLNAGQSEVANFSFTYDPSWGTGQKYIFYQSDAWNHVVNEQDEFNNIGVKSIQISNAQQPDPNYVYRDSDYLNALYQDNLANSLGLNNHNNDHIIREAIDSDDSAPNGVDNDNQVYALVGGEVLEAQNGRIDSAKYWGNNGTVAIYNSDLNKTFIYAHFAEGSIDESLQGKIIAAGSRIGIEGNTGASYGDHTHVEVHEGRVNIDMSNPNAPRHPANSGRLHLPSVFQEAVRRGLVKLFP